MAEGVWDTVQVVLQLLLLARRGLRPCPLGPDVPEHHRAERGRERERDRMRKQLK